MKRKIKKPSKIEVLKLNIQSMYDNLMLSYGPERLELARNRLRIHQANMDGRWNFNPYTEPDTDWFVYDGD